MLPLNIITDFAAQIGVTLPANAPERFNLYARLLLDANEKINLTAITEPQAVAVRHFCDSLTLLEASNPPPGVRVADVGTGAGFPGVVLLIVRPDLKITLIDGLKKRLTVLADILEKLANEGINVSYMYGYSSEGVSNLILKVSDPDKAAVILETC